MHNQFHDFSGFIQFKHAFFVFVQFKHISAWFTQLCILQLGFILTIFTRFSSLVHSNLCEAEIYSHSHYESTCTSQLSSTLETSARISDLSSTRFILNLVDSLNLTISSLVYSQQLTLLQLFSHESTIFI